MNKPKKAKKRWMISGQVKHLCHCAMSYCSSDPKLARLDAAERENVELKNRLDILTRREVK